MILFRCLTFPNSKALIIIMACLVKGNPDGGRVSRHFCLNAGESVAWYFCGLFRVCGSVNGPDCGVVVQPLQSLNSDYSPSLKTILGG